MHIELSWPPVTPASHIVALVHVPSAPLPIEPPANLPGKTAELDQTLGPLPVTQETRTVSGLWLPPGPPGLL